MNSISKTEAPLSEDECRELFFDAASGELPSEMQSRFERALHEHEELRAEYQQLKLALVGLQEGPSTALTEVSVLSSVQEEIAEKTVGKFFRDRYARRFPKWLAIFLYMQLLLVLLALVYSWMRNVWE